MIKKIIFDIDNTLLNTYKDCIVCYKSYFESKGLDDLSQKVYNIIGDYDQFGNYDKDDLTNYIQDKLGIKFTRSDFDEMFNIYGNTASLVDENIPKVLEVLSKYYELVALSKWYVDNQKSRLKNVGILKYFKEIYGFENAGIKPSRDSFITACGDNLPSECLVVGDSIPSDMVVPIDMGMKTLLYTKEVVKDYDCISNLSEINGKIHNMMFDKELSYIKDDRVRNSAVKLHNMLPEYFYHIAASATGKYHPISDLGEGGLVRHSKSVVRIGYELLQLEMYNIFSDIEKDLILFSLMFHDGLKQGLNGSGYTLFDHPLIISKFIKDNKDMLYLDSDEINYVTSCISSHMGEWNKKDGMVLPKPVSEQEKFVHLCDYIASRNFINIDYDEDNNIIERRKRL